MLQLVFEMGMAQYSWPSVLETNRQQAHWNLLFEVKFLDGSPAD